MKNIRKALAVFALIAAFAGISHAQATLSSTTLASAVAGPKPGVAPDTTIFVSSVTNMTTGMIIYTDVEAMQINSINSTANSLGVTRGWNATRAMPHANGSTVYWGPANYFRTYSKAGACTSTNELVLPQINVYTGERWNCIAGQWMIDNGAYVIPATGCSGSQSGGTLVSAGYTTIGTANIGVVQVSTSTTTSTHTYVCNLDVPRSIGTVGRNVAILDVVFFYGVQTNALGTQANVLASGTFNGTTVFGKITMPSPAASETASTVTPVRADSGTMVITPVVGSFNTATTTAGAFYSAKFIPAGGYLLTSDLQQYTLSVSLLGATGAAQVTNTPGVLVHYAYVPDSMAR